MEFAANLQLSEYFIGIRDQKCSTVIGKNK